MRKPGQLWALLLAAGDGNRVRSLTRTTRGVSAPKQFCALHGEESLLRWTINRARSLVPEECVVTVVAVQHRQWWEQELADCPAQNVIVQPLNRGTAAGMLLPLLAIVRRDPSATIVVLPSDHYVANEAALRRAIARGIRSARTDGARVVLLGMSPRESDTSYGWIVPSVQTGAVRGVTAFVEKPDRETARLLLYRGALWNSLILVATGRELLRLFTRVVPDLVGDFISWRDEAGGGWEALERMYRTLAPCDFSRDVLEAAPDALSVIDVPDCGWMDVGTPTRLESFHTDRARTRAPDVQAVG